MYHHRQLPSRLIGALFEPKLLEEGRDLKLREIQSNLAREYGIDILYDKALACQCWARTLIYGDHVQSWDIIPSYMYILRKENPRSIIKFETDDEDRFKYVS